LALILSATVPFGLFVAFNYKEYGLYYINDDHYLSILGSIGSVGNGVFRMFWGIVLDVLPFKKIQYIMIGIFMVSCATIIWSVQNNASYLITVLVTYGTYGGLYSIYPTQTVRMLGRQLGPKLYYITFFGFAFGAILQYAAHKFLVEEFKQEGYTYCFIIFGAFLIASLVLTFTINLENDKKEVKNSTTLEE
jgi:MFS family permease